MKLLDIIWIVILFIIANSLIIFSGFIFYKTFDIMPDWVKLIFISFFIFACGFYLFKYMLEYIINKLQ